MNCGTERTLYISTDMQINELQFHGKCLQCNSSIQVTFGLMGTESTASSTSSSSSSSSSSAGEQPLINLDETLFEPELPTDALKDLIEE